MTLLPVIALTILFLGGFLALLLKTHKAIFQSALILHCTGTALLMAALPISLSRRPVTVSLGAPETLGGILWSYGPVEILMAATFSVIATLILWSAMPAIAKEIPSGRIPIFVLVFHLIHGSVLGIVLSGQIFNGFILLEVIGLASAVLIALKDKEENLKTAMKYLIFSSLGSGLVLMGVVTLYATTGFLTFLKLGTALPGLVQSHPWAVPASLLFFTSGLGIKGALFPLHFWLPDAHGFAPTPASALLSALVIKAPAFMLVKLAALVYSPEIPEVSLILNILAGTAAVGILVASVLARSQTQLKRMIAYSSVSQIGYVFLGIGLGTPGGIVVALYHMIAHGLAKASIFLCAGSFIEQTGFHDVSEFKGIGREMPYTLGFFTLSAFSMVGIPLLPGFISKFSMALESIHAGKYIYLGVLLLSSLLGALYYFPIIINGYFGEDNLKGKLSKSRMKPFRELVPLLVLSVLMIFAGFLSGPVLDILHIGLFAG